MQPAHAPPDHEAVYRLVLERQWTAVLDLVHRHHAAVAADALLARATETFVTSFLSTLAREGAAALGEDLEKLFLLHTGRFYRLSPLHFEQVVAALVRLHRDRPEAALGYARFCPDHPDCAAVIAQHGPPRQVQVEHAGADAVRLAQSLPLSGSDHTRSLFKSRQEVAFFMAMREVFATYFVYPNAALRCLIDFEAIRDRLSAEERRYFFRALVDCVVFDQHDRYRPLYFFELDSALHDAPAQQARDRHKDRILALAGQKLYRIRKQARHVGRDAFVALIKEIVARENEST